MAGGEGLSVSFPFLTTRLTALLCSDLVRVSHFARGAFTVRSRRESEDTLRLE